MNQKFPLAVTAALIADPARAAMLTALLDARPRSAGELARIANVSAQSASMHLSQLVTGGFLTVGREGRHRFYILANRHIAYAIEALGSVSTPTPLTVQLAPKDRDLRYARTCYDHLAGELGVTLTAALEQYRVLVPSADGEYAVTPGGEKFLSNGKSTQPDCGKHEDHLHGGVLIGQRSVITWQVRWEPQFVLNSSHVAGSSGKRILASFACRCVADVS